MTDEQIDERISKLGPPPPREGVPAPVSILIQRENMRTLVVEMDRLIERNARLGKEWTEWQQERSILLRHIAELENKQ